MFIRTGVAVLLACAELLVAGHFDIARADGAAKPAVSAADAAEAEQLFDAAKALMNTHDYAHACPAFAASQEKDPAAGTLLNLANCYAKNEQTASAWVTFKDAAAASRLAHRKDWETLAQKRVAELEPKLSHLTVRLADPTVTVSLTRDDRPMRAEEISTPILVDPGTHRIDANAPGKMAAHVEVTIGGDGDSKEALVPRLDDVPVAPLPVAPVAHVAPPPPPPPREHSPLKTIGLVTAIVGGAGLAIGTITGVLAIGKNNDAKSACPGSGACGDKSAVDDSSSAQSLGTVSTIGFIAGGALVAGGVTMILLAPKNEASDPTSASVRISPLFSRDRAGFGLSGAF